MEAAPEYPSSPARLAPGDRLLDYRILESIGRGGFGDVFLAEHEVLRRVVAIKIPRDAGASPALGRAARIQASLDDRGIIRTLEASLSHDPPYVVFEYVAGPSLAELTSRGGPLPWRRALPLLRDVARALRHTHARGFVHGDVKPANVLVATDEGFERARLTDFGGADTAPASCATVCSSVALDTTRQCEVVGTVPYMAPEVIRGARLDARADIFAFGVLAFEVLTGHLPEGRELPSDLVSGIPRELDLAFDCCFARRERRAENLDEVLLLLERADGRRWPVEAPCRVNPARRIRPSPARMELDFMSLSVTLAFVALGILLAALGG
jgi:serine/threonine protein kinase